MGTDIHCSIEFREGPDGDWKHTLFPGEGWWRDGVEYDPDNDYTPRCYAFFAALAGVRNGYGFAGLPSHTPLEPIAENRGLPSDVTDETLKAAEEPDVDDHWLGDHSFTWVSLRELQELRERADGHIIKRAGVVGLEQYRKLKESGEAPEAWSGWVSGGNTRVVSEDADLGSLPPGPEYYVQMTWDQNLVESFDWILDRWIKHLETLGGPDDVRVVMGFDS